MKRNWKNSVLTITFVMMLLLVASCGKNGDHADHADTYTCPMHPTVVQDRPGTCPVCGMDLVRKARAGEEVEITEELSRLIKSPNEMVVASIETIKGEYKSLPVSIEAQGIVTYDTRNIYTIPARMSGRLDKVYLKYPFQQVRSGQKIAEIYSPELLTAQRELIFVLENDTHNETLINSAKERLRLLGATESQITSVISGKELKATFSVYSPHEGYVLADAQETPVAPPNPTTLAGNTGGMDGMGTTGTTGQVSSAVPITTGRDLLREGSYVASGQTLFKIVNTAALRVELNLPAASASSVKKGSEVMLDFGNGNQTKASVDFIQPFFSEGQEFVTIRVYTDQIDQLHIGHLVNAKIISASIEALWVPEEAVLDLGVDKVVFIRSKNVLRPRKVITGMRTENEIEIKQGLSSSDEIAANAQFLVDSESFIKTQK